MPLGERLPGLDPSRFHVVCLPDFFMDHFVELPPWDDAVGAMRRVHEQGGGNVQGVPQHFASGGNAANTALALARLGVRAHLVTRTSPFGLDVLRSTLGRAGVDLSRVKADGRLAVTTALEMGPEKRNVMLSDPGSVRTFGFPDLDENDRTLIEGADAVLVANWSQCAEGGTGLIRGVADLASRHDALVYVDTGDPSGRAGEIDDFVRDVLQETPIGVLAVNENELRHYSREGTGSEEEALRAGSSFAKRLKGTLDLHTSRFTASWTDGNEPAVVPTRRLVPRRLTGAGDAWNAGNILGYLAGFDPADRLAFANATAGFYIESQDGRHGSLKDIAARL